MSHHQLPTYQEATTPLDWLEPVAPYVRFSDYRALCLVSSHFWRVFAPRLWSDPLRTVRQAGLDPGDDLAWWLEFVFNRLAQVRPTVRALVQVLDVRGFAKAVYHFASDEHYTTFQKSFERALELCPNVDSILLDGHPDIEPWPLLQHQRWSGGHSPLILSLAGCPVKLPNAFFSSAELHSLVFLDLSELRGSLVPLTTWPQHLSRPLPELRVLKLRKRELDDSQLLALVHCFKLRLWSLDLSDNKITDTGIDYLTSACFPVQTLRSDAQFQVEGKLNLSDQGAPEYGAFSSIEESEFSRDFSHPDRYLADAPGYALHTYGEPQEYQVFRSDGCQPTLHDSAEAALAILSAEGKGIATTRFRTSRGLSHLNLSHNKASGLGLMSLMRNSNGQLEHVICDSMPLFSLPFGFLQRAWPWEAKLHGMVGGAHVFRPVFSSNLRVLRIHHSLVTHIPTLEKPGWGGLSRTFLSENTILPRVEQVYPHPFVPDANPRLYSLTLTCIPRRSSGPLTKALIRFLERLSLQERAIEQARTATPSRRGPRILQGLRHLRLEFESDVMNGSFSTSIDLDAEKLLNSGDQVFSFFEERGSQAAATNPARDVSLIEPSSAGAAGGHSSMKRDTDDYVTYRGEWNGKTFSVRVWIGTAAPHHNSVINDYRRLVLDHKLQVGVGPASPCQVAAGAPSGSYVFHTAWCAAVMPKRFIPPAEAQLEAMHDVLHELKKYRAACRARYMALRDKDPSQPTLLGPPHYHWTGRLEVSTTG